jgi:malate synthase
MRTSRAGLAVDTHLADFVEDELVTIAGIDPQVFWSGLAEMVVQFGPRNAELLSERVRLQQAFDTWLASRSANELSDVAAQVEYLTSIGYLIPEPEPFSITTVGCDPEIGQISGPQLVVPATNARYALNAANARWGSLYDALYGTDALGSLPPVGPYNLQRGSTVIQHVRELLDRYLPLVAGTHRNARSYSVRDGQLHITQTDGTVTGLIDPDSFVGYSGQPAQPEAVVFRHHGLLIEICFDAASPVGATDPAGIRDVNLEAAVTVIVDLEDSVATVDAEDKVHAYRTWLGLLEGDLQAPVPGRGMRRLHSDRIIHAPDGAELVLSGRAVLLVRNVGLHMYSDSVLDATGAPIPEGILDALITVTAGRIDTREGAGLRNSRTGSIYVVKPKLHGPAEVRHAVAILAAAERIADLSVGTVKIGIMDEERRTSANLAACIEAASDRVAFINTGFLDRTGDEIRTWMRAGPVLGKEAMRSAPWMLAYEDRNVDLGLAAQFPGRAQIGKGMWAAPDRMADMLERKSAHPNAGASCAWVPSPTAATLHALHYHDVDVRHRQREVMAAGPRRLRAELLVPPLADQLDELIVQQELDNAAQGILGYVVRWVMQGVGCSKVPDIHDIGLMEDRATLRISSQLLANWRLHGVLTDAQIEEAFQRMSLVVDEQNSSDSQYLPIAGQLTAPAMVAALRLVREGADEPGGYTERVLTDIRRTVKGSQTS